MTQETSSGIIVYKKIVPKDTVEETIQRCLTVYEDKLLACLDSEEARRDLDTERMVARHSETFLPDRFKGKSYSRLRSVFAFPHEFPESWCYPNLVPSERSFADGETVIRMRVDGTSALVLPMDEVNCFYAHGYSPDEQRDIRHIRRYWESAVTLEEFASDFTRVSEREYIWYSKNGSIENPEVIIPESVLDKVTFLDVPELKDQF